MIAIELLLADGAFQAADELVMNRLNDARLFKWLALPGEGLACMEQFLAAMSLQ